MTDSSAQRPAYVIALTDQIHAALRDKDGDRFADTVRALYLRDLAVARTVLREGLQRAAEPGHEDSPATDSGP